MPIKSFADQMTADVAAGLNTKHSRRLPQRVWTVAQRKLDMLQAAKTIDDLAAFPGNRVKPLNKTKPGYHSLWINDQYRLIFKFEKGEAHDVYIEGEDHTGRR